MTLRWQAYRFRPSLANDMKHANLILSHAGAGSIMEGLSCARDEERRRFEEQRHDKSTNFYNDNDIPSGRKKVVVVINNLLMNNHQLELANALGSRGHLFVIKDADMLLQKDVLDEMEEFVPKVFEGGDNLAFRRVVDNLLGCRP